MDVRFIYDLFSIYYLYFCIFILSWHFQTIISLYIYALDWTILVFCIVFLIDLDLKVSIIMDLSKLHLELVY